MFSNRKIVFFFIFFLISFLMIAYTVNAEKKKEHRVIFQGKVIDISEKFITVERTSIALPKNIKTLDSSGASIPFRAIKKGDYVIVTVENNEATIKKAASSRIDGNKKLIPQ